MKDGNLETLEVENAENISGMILKFRQCADTAAELSNSVGKFTNIYLNVEKNVTQLEGIEKNLNSNNYIKELLDVTDNMKNIFNYFNDNIPQLSKSLQSSKKELNLHKDELVDLLDHFNDLPNQMDNITEKIKLMLSENVLINENSIDKIKEYIEDKNKKVESDHKRKNKIILEEIRKQLDTGFLNFKNETLNQINESVNKTINEKIKCIISDFDDMSNNIVESITGSNKVEELNSIYNLYIQNGRELPIYVQKLTWSRNFYFRVDKIEKDKSEFIDECFMIVAYGQRLSGKNYYDTFEVSADQKQFKSYKNINFIVEKADDITPIQDGDIPF